MKFDSETNGVRPELNFQNSWYMNMHSSYLHSCSRSLSLQFLQILLLRNWIVIPGKSNLYHAHFKHCVS